MKFRKLYKLVADQGWKPSTKEERGEALAAVVRKSAAVAMARRDLVKHVYTAKLLRSGKTSKCDALAKDPAAQTKGRPWAARLHSAKTEGRGVAIADEEFKLKFVTKHLQGGAA